MTFPGVDGLALVTSRLVGQYGGRSSSRSPSYSSNPETSAAALPTTLTTNSLSLVLVLCSNSYNNRSLLVHLFPHFQLREGSAQCPPAALYHTARQVSLCVRVTLDRVRSIPRCQLRACALHPARSTRVAAVRKNIQLATGRRTMIASSAPREQRTADEV